MIVTIILAVKLYIKPAAYFNHICCNMSNINKRRVINFNQCSKINECKRVSCLFASSTSWEIKGSYYNVWLQFF